MAERDRASRLIEEDEASASLFSFYSIFYEELPEARRASLRRIDRFVREILPLPRRIRLHPSPAEAEREPIRLPDEASAGAVVLTSGPEDEDVRVLINPVDERYRIYAVAEDEDVSAYALVSLADVRLALDAAGRGTLSLPDERPLHFLLDEADLRPAQHVATVESLTEEPEDVIPGFSLRLRAEEEDLGAIPPLEADVNCAEFFAVRWKGGQAVVEATGPEAVLSIEEPAEIYTLSLHC